jgi:hypothetical protein
MSPVPDVFNAQGFEFANTQHSAPRSASLVKCLFDMTTAYRDFPPELQDPLLSGLGQLMIGFPAYVGQHTEQVRSSTLWYAVQSQVRP